jgi:twitching motility protein PilT
VAALEIMLGTTAIRNLIREGKSHLVPNVIMTAKKEGMQLLDQHLREMINQKIITADEAARFAAEPQSMLAQPGAATKAVATADSR